MLQDFPSLLEMEEACIPVRKAETGILERLTLPYLKKGRGLLSFLRSDSHEHPGTIDLLAASEALVMVGEYREAVLPLEELATTGGIGHRIRDLALARAGQIAIIRELPVDLSPIVSEIGLSRRDTEAALAGLRSARGKKEPLVDFEKNMLQAMLLHQRSSWMESGRMNSGHLRAAFEAYTKAMDLVEKLPPPVRDHHEARYLLESGRFLLDAGDLRSGMENIRRSVDISRRCGSKVILLDGYLATGIWEDNEQEARDALKKSMELAMRLRNNIALSDSEFILGRRMCREGEVQGVDRIIHSAGIVEEARSSIEAAMILSEASLWSTRLGNPERGIELAKDSYKRMKSVHDREDLSRVLCILLYGYLSADDRKKAKKLLLELVNNYPVKQFPDNFSIMKEAVSGIEWLREDRDTSELFEEEPVYKITRYAVEEIKSRARDAYPNEFGAMLRGIDHITHIEPIMEGASNRSSFMFSLFSRFTQREVPGEGVVHSHPSGSARPSKADVSLFGRFPGINIIIAYPFEDDSMAAYDRMGNRVRLEIEK